MTGKEEPRISAIVHTYNASKHLDKCLSALHGFDEILIIDMESTDGTVEIARRHGARVEIVERGEHRLQEAYKNYGIKAAAYDWIIEVDADEMRRQLDTL